MYKINTITLTPEEYKKLQMKKYISDKREVGLRYRNNETLEMDYIELN